MKYVLSIVLAVCSVLLSAQVFTGKILDEAERPLQNAKIYVDGTTIAASTDEGGNFHIDVSTAKIGTMVFQKEGYSPSAYSYNAVNIKHIRVILMRESSIEGVQIMAYSDKKHAQYINRFLNEFLGSNNREIEIKNPRDIVFAYDKSSSTLYAKSKKPLIVENSFLGYLIEYQLINFSFNEDSKLVMFSGTTHYKNLKGNTKKDQQWTINRLNTYYGSSLHFFREAYAGTLKEAGYSVNRAVKVKNPKYPSESERKKYSEYLASDFKTVGWKNLTPELEDIQKRLSKEQEMKLEFLEFNIPQSKFIFKTGERTMFAFEDLMVTAYTKFLYREEHGKIVKSPVSKQSTAIADTHGTEFEISNEGYCSPVNEMTFENDWGKERLTELLPLDYVPGH